ncbi:MAG TPA: sigma factor-like helix-turn-helix DNA-binding protein [Acidimicrobiales bacterium]|nr:sigma factor-like helix-turn-helix DNA-binding protein [Acidimicrobiales bacterium]
MQAVLVAGRGAGSLDDAGLFASLYPSLRAFAAVTGSVDVEPDDLVQEAVARTLRHHQLVDLDDAGAYLRRAIVNLAANRRRSMARFRVAFARLDRVDEAQAPEYGSDMADLLRLEPDARALLYMIEVEGHSYAEASVVLGITEEAARARAIRARRRLRAEVEGARDE